MKIGITYRLVLSLLGATGLVVLLLFLVMQWSIDREFYRYLGQMEEGKLERIANNLSSRYGEKGNWEFLKTEPMQWPVDEIMPPPGSDVPPQRDEMPGPPPPGPPPFDSDRPRSPLVVLDADHKTVFGAEQHEDARFRPILVNNTVVGYAGLLSPRHFPHPMQIQFLSRQKTALAFSAAGMVLIIILVSLPLAKRILSPVKSMAAATRAIASGKYDTRIMESSSDELGQLAQDFNTMAAMLGKHEYERRQWIADISHELRTPVAVLRGEIEALLDSVREITPERVRSLHSETLRLNRLVEDLYQLSLSDVNAMTYRKEDLSPAAVLKNSLSSFRPEFERKGIGIDTCGLEITQPLIFADAERLNQLFANLFENSLRYTDNGGRLRVEFAAGAESVIIEIQDSAPNASDGDLERIFDRLFRVETSRSRSTGGAGLGLAICKSIVEAHEGTISADQSPLGGLLIKIAFPLRRRTV
jgi:two-component system sensor histidine kinase BaeS